MSEKRVKNRTDSTGSSAAARPQTNQRQRMKAKVKKKRTGFLVVTLAVLAICAICLCNSIVLKNRISENAAIEADLTAQIEAQLVLEEDLQKESEYILTDEYIEQIAREKLGLVRKGEIIFKKQQN